MQRLAAPAAGGWRGSSGVCSTLQTLDGRARGAAAVARATVQRAACGAMSDTDMTVGAVCPGSDELSEGESNVERGHARGLPQSAGRWRLASRGRLVGAAVAAALRGRRRARRGHG